MPMPLAQFTETLKKTPPVECDFQVGDTVEFTNDQGVVFTTSGIHELKVNGFRAPLKVIGFADEVWQGRFVHLNTSCYWFPKEPEALRKINVGPIPDTVIM